MIYSMTGFAGVERQTALGRLAWEMRSVNHRYLEIGLRLPEELRALEPAVRDLLGQQLSRGKVDASLRYTRAQDMAESGLTLNTALAQRLLAMHLELQQLCGSSQEASPNELLRWPGMVSERPVDSEPLHKAALDLLAEALVELKASRGREGQKLGGLILERLDGVGSVVQQVRAWLPEIRLALKQRLLDRLADLPQDLDPGRIEQEVALLVQKIDVDEELDRLDAHVDEARRILGLNEPAGRRLDFLMQEFNRESNTLSSKSVDKRTTQAAVELKVLIEQMREQVQNIE
ncbi:MAG TPA: YicC/YloC family endoribonuclease [Xanthomonadales bacterium]|nr:YicC/YloC family endoribonuclease [Xanthomonadales bacterium]